VTTDNRHPTDHPSATPARLSINQETVRQLAIPDLIDGCSALGIPGVGFWRAQVQEYGVEAAAKLARDAGVTVTSLCRGGFFTASDAGRRKATLADNRTAIDAEPAPDTTSCMGSLN
jgi:sugar phosphate isomerase/epimerase